ncbi:uncharacterized protein BCR38DRAFT_418130 [Pseudomassariella vexata]|uniref:Uncharacterized protein n=1 Tax=Pseudomassariella vexata TaxID=1141098 RepID=A0A1Y2EJT0_9PEZI|nr:uncharacterized protein BCR38DRAFT_418130 [Pseudomassariella vexata]ORY71808.1 hypothetical protein BCR38DRAFT_418130 [Pseudomassariella vexata]
MDSLTPSRHRLTMPYNKFPNYTMETAQLHRGMQHGTSPESPSSRSPVGHLRTPTTSHNAPCRGGLRERGR